MANVRDAEKHRTRRERTFVGSECAVCEEPLEHTLRGERVLQFSCGHVSHEACFYGYIREFDSQYCPTCSAPLGLDSSRGRNVLDIEKLSSIVRSVAGDTRSQQVATPTPWDTQTIQSRGRESNTVQTFRTVGKNGRDVNTMSGSNRDSRESRDRLDRGLPNFRSDHHRTDSEAAYAASSSGYDATFNGTRRYDYDGPALETTHSTPRTSLTRPSIPFPVVSVRAEFPSITRSQQQQTLTCLITIEIPESKWQPDLEDFRNAPPLPTPAIPPEDSFARPPSPAQSAPRFRPCESAEVLEEVTENLRLRVDNWHGLDFHKFGKLLLYGTVRVGKDGQSWQELECYVFGEMLICVKEKSAAPPQWDDEKFDRKHSRCVLKGSILIKKHLNDVVETSSKAHFGQTEKITAANLRPSEEFILTLSLSVAELPSFHLRFETRNQLKLWQQALLDLHTSEASTVATSPDYDCSETDDDEWQRVKRVTPDRSSHGRIQSVTTAPSDPNDTNRVSQPLSAIHVPIDIVVVVPVSSSMQGVKINLVRDALSFMLQNLGDRDRMGIIIYGSSAGAAPLVGMTTKTWHGWAGVLSSIRPVGEKSLRADVAEGANVAMDLLMQRKANNPIATILLISDSSTSDSESVDFVVSRAEAAKIAIHSFGLGMTHKPDTMIELSTRTKASYTYVKDWMMLRECLAGSLGSLQTMSHQNVKLKLRLPEGSPAKFVKISGALQTTKRATGKDAEASLGDLRFGDKKDILVQLVILPDTASQEQIPQDPWETIVSGLEALGGRLDQEDQRTLSIEEIAILQVDLNWGDFLRDGTLTHLPRPSLLAITMLPTAVSPSKRATLTNTPPIPPHPLVVQRRMELLTSDMLTRALTLVSRNQHERAQHLLTETRSILKGLGKGGLPPIPPTSKSQNNISSSNPDISSPASGGNRRSTPSSLPPNTAPTQISPTAVSRHQTIDNLSVGASPGIDAQTVAALDTELEASLEWINHPAVFGRDSRKAILQAIGVISNQRGYTFRTPIETLWATRISGIKGLTERSREWREESGSEGGIREEG